MLENFAKIVTCPAKITYRDSKKERLLKLLHILDRSNSKIAVDFMIDLPVRTISDPRYMMVIVDRLKCSVIIK